MTLDGATAESFAHSIVMRTKKHSHQTSFFDPRLPTDVELADKLSWAKERPKIDLHRHLLGSITPDMFRFICKRHNISLLTKHGEELDDIITIRERVDGLQPFFRPWPTLSSLLVEPSVLTTVTYLVLREAAKDNIVYTELRATWGMTAREKFSVKQFLAAIQAGLVQAEQDFGIIGRVVLGITRHLFGRHTLDHRRRLWANILNAASQYRDSVVVGFDVSGVELHHPVSLYTKELSEITEAAFPLTIHCGETTPASDVRAALQVKPVRLSHALSAAADPLLLEHLANNNVVVEACPTTNWLTQTVDKIEQHPVLDMFDHGVPVTLATDNPAIVGTTLSREYALVLKLTRLSELDVGILITNAHKFMFGNSTIRAIVGKKIGGMSS